jgi:hypothetical protein
MHSGGKAAANETDRHGQLAAGDETAGPSPRRKAGSMKLSARPTGPGAAADGPDTASARSSRRSSQTLKPLLAFVSRPTGCPTPTSSRHRLVCRRIRHRTDTCTRKPSRVGGAATATGSVPCRSPRRRRLAHLPCPRHNTPSLAMASLPPGAVSATDPLTPSFGL